MKKKNNTDWDILFNYWQNGNLSCAFECVELFIEKTPHTVNGWIVKADILSNFARYSEAEKHLQEAEKLLKKESMFLVYNQYGHLYKNKGDLKKAKKLYKKSLANKETSEGYNFLGSPVVHLGKS